MEAERNVEVSVVDDDEAYVGYEELPTVGNADDDDDGVGSDDNAEGNDDENEGNDNAEGNDDENEGNDNAEGNDDENEGNDDDDERGKEITVQNDHYVPLIRVKNRFPHDSGIRLAAVKIDCTRPGSGSTVQPPFDGLFVGITDGDYNRMTGVEVEKPDGVHSELPSERFGSGDCADYIARIEGDPGPYKLEVTIRVEGPGVSAEVFGDTREFRLVVNGDDNDDSSEGD
jgi:hypothetical protein